MAAPSLAIVAQPRARPGVMIVEDDLAVRETVQELLEEEGYRVIPASNGREALERLHQASAPSVILIDLMMPVMDGWQLRAELARDPRLSGIPVVVMSADARVEQKAKGLSVAAILQKPVTLDHLLDTVGRLSRGAS
jgi:CheY-like chemotaxis protein